MTKIAYLAMVRAEVESLPAELRDVIGIRALGCATWVWSSLTTAQLDRLYGAARVIALLTEVSP